MKTVSVLAAKRLGITKCDDRRSLAEAAQLMVEEDISSVILVDKEGWLEGILTRTDILRAALSDEANWRQAPCYDWMTRDVITVLPTATLAEAAQLLQEKAIHRVVVAEEEDGRQRPLAVISDGDVLYHLVARGV